MYHVLSESQNGNVGIKIEEKLTKDDYELLIPYISKLTQEVGPIRLLFDMTECEGVNSQAWWEELSRQFQQFHGIAKVAVVGDHLWMEYGTKVFHPLLNTTVKYYTPNQRDKAWNWVERDEI